LIGSLYVKTAEVYKTNNEMTAIAEVIMPTCSNDRRLTGHISFNYKSNDGGSFHDYTYPVDGLEGQNVSAYVNVPYSMSDSGYLQIIDNTSCVKPVPFD
jgi:hypothetical protein